jgi:SH3-like domain-containing protein
MIQLPPRPLDPKRCGLARMRMIFRVHHVLCLITLLAVPSGVGAQGLIPGQPATGMLSLPPKNQAASAPVHPPQPAPRTPVQQVAPFKSPVLAQNKAATNAKPPPVVQPSRNSHAQKPTGSNKAAVGAGVVAGAAAGAGAAILAKPPAVPTPPVAPQPAEKTPDPSKGSATGFPLPRWASLRSDEVNLRAGPGTRYPVQWVYRRRDLPVEIKREFEIWRLIEDQDHVMGWVNQATLVGRRSFVVTGAERLLRRSPSDDAEPVARLKPGVVGRVRGCEAGHAWCDMQVGDYRGWLKRSDVWGVYPDEAIGG